jgi:hypothetical protein
VKDRGTCGLPATPGDAGSPRQHVYDLSESETKDLTEEFLSTKTVAVAERFVCYEIDGADRFANIARQIEREVFEDTFGNDPAMLTNEYRPYEESSLFFLMVDTQAREPAGVLRMIRNSPAGLKTLVDMEDPTKTPTAVRTDDVRSFHGIDDLDRCWDGATSAVRRRYRRRLATVHVDVLRCWYAAALREDVEHFVSILDAPVYKVARDFLGVPLVALADTPPFTYMDAPNSQAVYARVPSSLAIAARVNRRVGQKIRDCLSDGSLPAPELLETHRHAE